MFLFTVTFREIKYLFSDAVKIGFEDITGSERFLEGSSLGAYLSFFRLVGVGNES